MSFSYLRRYELTQRHRPQIMVDFRRHDPESGRAVSPMTARANVVVDSGTDVTLLPERYAGGLGIDDITALDEEPIFGISGEITCYGRVHLDAYLCGNWVDVPVYFYRSDKRVGLLGRAGAFDALQIAFVNRRWLLYLSPVSGT